jgi:MraZ protein
MVVNLPMFIGEFEYRVDEKGRVPIPPKFRTEELKKEGVVLCPGADKCVAIYPISVWNKLAEALTSGPLVTSKMRKLNRALFATAFNAEMDAQGRITLPAQLRQFANLGEEVVVTGVNTFMELWNAQQWQQEKSSSQEESWHTIETMEPRQ